MKEYLGDSVYAERDEFDAIVLTTEDGIGVSNRIVLEIEVVEALMKFCKSKVSK